MKGKGVKEWKAKEWKSERQRSERVKGKGVKEWKVKSDSCFIRVFAFYTVISKKNNFQTDLFDP